VKLTIDHLLRSISSWRVQIAEAIDADDPKAVLAHLDASMAQGEEFLRRLTNPTDEIDQC